MSRVELRDIDGRPIGHHVLLGDTMPLVLFKGDKAYIPDTGALRELLPGEAIPLWGVLQIAEA